MRRAFLNSALLAGGLFAAACTEQRAPLPTEGPRFDLSPLSCPPAASEIDAMITALFPSGDLLMSAQNFFNNIKGKVQKGDPASLAMAQSKTLKFVDFTIKNYRRGKLLDPNGSSPPTTQTAVVDLINALFCFSSFPTGTSITTDQLGLPGSSGGSAVIGSDGGRFTTGEAQPLAGLVVPAGAVSSDHLFAIARHDELTPPGQPSQCLGATNATVTQYPLCYSYSVFPPTDFAQEVILAVCQVEPPPPQPIRGRLRLAHPNPEGGIRFTRLVADPFPLLCTDAAVSSGTGGIGVLLKRLGSFAARVVGPKVLFAGHSGLGGGTCCFTNFIAVDSAPDLIIESMSHSPTNPTAADPITVTAVVKNIGVAPAGASTVAFAVGIPTPPTASVPALGVGASFPASVTVPARVPGTYQDTARADVNNDVTESNEANNVLISAPYTVIQALFGSSSAGGGPRDVSEPNPGSLFAIDPATGQARLIGSTGINGGRGVPEVSAIAFDPATGTLYGITGSACSDAKLITINTSTGAGTLVGSLVGTGFNGALGGTGPANCTGGSDALAFSSDGTLYAGGWNGGTTFGGKLLTVDKTTGAVLTVFQTTSGIHLAGLAFSPSGVLWSSRGNNGPGFIHTINPADGQTLSTVALKTATGATDPAVVSDLSFGPDGTLYASLPEENELATIDPTTGLLTRIGGFGTAVRKMSGLRFGP